MTTVAKLVVGVEADLTQMQRNFGEIPRMAADLQQRVGTATATSVGTAVAALKQLGITVKAVSQAADGVHLFQSAERDIASASAILDKLGVKARVVAEGAAQSVQRVAATSRDVAEGSRILADWSRQIDATDKSAAGAVRALVGEQRMLLQTVGGTAAEYAKLDTIVRKLDQNALRARVTEARAVGEGMNAIQRRISLLTQGVQLESTRAASLTRLAGIESGLTRSLAQANLTLSQRIQLTQQLDRVQTTLAQSSDRVAVSVRQQQQGITALGRRAAPAVTAVAFAFEGLARGGVAAQSGVRAALRSVSSFASVLGPKGLLVGAIAGGTLAIVELFSKSREEMQKTVREFSQQLGQLATATDQIGLQKLAQDVIRGSALTTEGDINTRSLFAKDAFTGGLADLRAQIRTITADLKAADLRGDLFGVGRLERQLTAAEKAAEPLEERLRRIDDLLRNPVPLPRTIQGLPAVTTSFDLTPSNKDLLAAIKTPKVEIPVVGRMTRIEVGFMTDLQIAQAIRIPLQGELKGLRPEALGPTRSELHLGAVAAAETEAAAAHAEAARAGVESTLHLASALGVLDDEAADAVSAILSVAGAMQQFGQGGAFNQLTGALGIAGGLASLLSPLFSGESEAARAERENTQAIIRMTRALEGNDAARFITMRDVVSEAAGGAGGFFNNLAELSAAAAAAGLTLAEVKAAAAELGIDITQLTTAQLDQFVEALDLTIAGLTRWQETLDHAQRAQSLRNQVFDVEMTPLRSLTQSLTLLEDFAPALAERFAGIDISTAAGRERVEREMRELTDDFLANLIPPELMGAFDREALVDWLLNADSALDDFTKGLRSATGELLNIPTGYRLAAAIFGAQLPEIPEIPGMPGFPSTPGAGPVVPVPPPVSTHPPGSPGGMGIPQQPTITYATGAIVVQIDARDRSIREVFDEIEEEGWRRAMASSGGESAIINRDLR